MRIFTAQSYLQVLVLYLFVDFDIRYADAVLVESTTLNPDVFLDTENVTTTTIIEGTALTTVTFKLGNANLLVNDENNTSECEQLAIENINATEVLATQVTLQVDLQNQNSSLKLCNVTLYVSCHVTDDSNSLNVDNSTTVSNLTVELIIGDLSEYTMYTCILYLDNGSKNTSLNFTTAEAPPSMPENFDWNNVTSTSFTLTWSAPVKIPTTLLGYNLTITRTNETSNNHYYTGCEGDPNSTISIYVNNEILDYTFENALADFNYDVGIAAWSLVGLGDWANLSLSTDISVSKAPQNVQCIITEVHQEKNVINNLFLSWEMPCNTNGPVSYFQIEVAGLYKYNEIITDNRSFNLSVTSQELSLDIADLMAASNYNLSLRAVSDLLDTTEGEAYYDTLVTAENYPAKVQTVTSFLEDEVVRFTWEEPANHPGNVTHYEFSLNYVELNWNQTEWCIIGSSLIRNLKENVTKSQYSVTNLIPSAIYNVSVAAVTSRGSGNVTNGTVTSYMTRPELANLTYTVEEVQVDVDNYNVTGQITIFPGCFNGPFNSFVLNITGTRSGYNIITSLITDWTDSNLYFMLEPEYLYNVEVVVENTNFTSNEREVSFTSPAGVPRFDDNSIADLAIQVTTTNAEILLQRDQFSDEFGTVLYLALIVSSANVTGGITEAWDSEVWPISSFDDPDIIYYQATPENWWPFSDYDFVSYVIGENSSCTDEDEICNRPLQPDTTYYVIVRVFTANYYRNSMPLKIVTDPLSNLAIILGLTIGLALLVGIAFVGFILWKKGVVKRLLETQKAGSKTAIPADKFIDFCDCLKKNPSFLKEQWEELAAKTEEMSSSFQTNIALLPQNKIKNRYIDIHPYEHTRVKLYTIDEDDEMSSDYINASYIKGYSNQIEYIACQGPTPSTARDFWKMVYQENVSMVVMVTRFIEKNKEKCHKYFPNNQETLIFGHDIEVKCTMELPFDIYYVRTLQIRKNDKQLTVTHMQFMEWPDFGVPKSSENIISFYYQMRKRWDKEGGLAVIHCSAGVGRTGTIIALDILSQALRAGKNIDVFSTVLELRRQRMKMVQTEDQYMYIYMTLRDMLLNDFKEDDDSNSEHLYQNIEPTARPAIAESRL